MYSLRLALFAFGLTVPVSASIGSCPLAFNTGAVGSCKFFGCAASRGPTHCSMGSCFCDEGFCRYPASSVHVQSRYCVQRVPESTCHVSRFCYKAGLASSFCEKGLCMCKWGYRLDEDGKCSSPSSSFSLSAGSNSTESSAEERKFLSESDRAVALNIAVFALWSSLFLSALTAVATFAYRKFRMQPAEETGYTQFLTCE